MGRGPGPGVRLLIRFVSVSAVGAVFFVFHGISFHLTPWSQTIINGIVMYAYPPQGQDDTTVVLFREQNLRDLKESYPVSYNTHAEVLDALSIHGPRAVFLDFVFIDKRPSEDVERLSRAICDLKKAGTAVYLAVPPLTDDRTATGTIEPSLLECTTPVSAEMDLEHGVSGVLTYSNGVPGPKGFLPAPAYAMAPARLQLVPEQEQPMEIIWGNGVAALNEKWMRCHSEGGLTQVLSMLRHDPMSVRRTCPYTRTITVGHLLGSSGDPDVEAALRGKAVFYGAGFQMTGDRVVSPVYAEMPGVYLHAMAYDNLVSFGGQYKRIRHEVAIAWVPGLHFVIPLSFVVDSLLLLSTAAILLVIDEPPAVVRRILARPARVPTSLKWLALGSVAVLVIVGLLVPASVPSVLVSLPLVLAATALLHLAAPAPRAPNPLREFLGRSATIATILWAGALFFLIVDYTLGFEAALLLVVLPAYFLYKVVDRDVVFVATALMLIVVSALSFYPPINLGPRNVIAYVAFFEVARHLLRHLAGTSADYFALRRAHPEAGEWRLSERVVRVLDWWFTVWAHGGAKGERHASVASQGA